MSEAHFSQSYAEARRRFLQAASEVGATIDSYPIDVPVTEELAIDVAMIGEESCPTIMTSSGVHGVEGFFGSAVQLAILEQLRQDDKRPVVRHVLIHGVNPFGFANLRRFNEDNVDLNRNFLDNLDDFSGAPEGYRRLHRFLNPQSPPSRFEPFKSKAIWNIFRFGLQPLKQAVAGGQYEFPKGIFFGGHRPCKSTQVVRAHCDSWVGKSKQIAHLDFHSGLGAFGRYKLLLVENSESKASTWYADTFGADHVEPLDATDATAYRVTGIFGEWLKKHFADREFYFAAAEFGTYNILRVLAAVRAENCQHHYGVKDSPAYRSAKAELLECFCPQDQGWRRQVVDAGLKIVAQAAETFEND